MPNHSIKMHALRTGSTLHTGHCSLAVNPTATFSGTYCLLWWCLSNSVEPPFSRQRQVHVQFAEQRTGTSELTVSPHTASSKISKLRYSCSCVVSSYQVQCLYGLHIPSTLCSNTPLRWKSVDKETVKTLFACVNLRIER